MEATTLEKPARKPLPAKGVAVPGLCAAMEARNVKRAGLAQATNLEPSTIWKLMRGKSRAGYAVLALICEALGATEEELTRPDEPGSSPVAERSPQEK